MQYLLDDQDRLKGVLWVSGEQRRDWIECGADVLIHDNTYNMDNLGYKLGVFSGISKEGLTFPVGTCFIVDEETCSYEWQFSTWLACQNGVAPTAVITDADPAVNCVVNTVFPEATHIWCRYHLMVNIFKNCRATVGGAIGRLINDWITVSKTQTRTAFTTRWKLLLQKYPSAAPYLEKRLGGSINRWGAPFIQSFTASSFASSRGEGANKDYKQHAFLRKMSLLDVYNHVTEVQRQKKKSERKAEIINDTARVESLTLAKQWMPDVTAALQSCTSGYCRKLCHAEIGSSGNYTVTGVFKRNTLPGDEEHEGEVTLTCGEDDVPDVDPGFLDLRRYTKQLDEAELVDQDPFRRAGVADFLSTLPEAGTECIILQVTNNMHNVSQYVVFYDPVQVDGMRVFKSHWCTCGMAVTAGVPCRHYFASHRQVCHVGFHLHLINHRWHKTELRTAELWTYGNNKSKLTVTLPPVPPSTRVTTVMCAALDKAIDIPINEQRRAKYLYGKCWGESRTLSSLICLDYGQIQEEEAEEFLSAIAHLKDKIRKRKALEMEPSESRPLLQSKQAVANVVDYHNPDNRAKNRRKCGNCKQVGHNRATCPLLAQAEKENQQPANGEAVATAGT
eukprot:jgi/Tetstr1/421459/TSEL_012408.t1